MTREIQAAGMPGPGAEPVEQGKSSGQRTSPAAPVVGRNAAMDFTKGALVMFMVIYHSLNYFHNDRQLLKYLHFLPPSFIFITGFLISSIYLVKYEAGDSRLSRRLFIRGFKLFLIFIGLNLLVNFLVKSGGNPRPGALNFLRENPGGIFITGDSELARFNVILPISYVLMLAGLLCGSGRIARPLLRVVSGVALVICLFLAARGHLAANLELLSMGLLGMVVGFVPMARLDRVAGRLEFILAAYFAYSIVITLWYPDYALNMVGVCLTLVLLYGLGIKAGENGFVTGRIILLGRYSLLAYIVQIAILQALSRGLRPVGSGAARLMIALIVTSILMTALIEATDRSRSKWRAFDRLYKAVFA